MMVAKVSVDLGAYTKGSMKFENTQGRTRGTGEEKDVPDPFEKEATKRAQEPFEEGSPGKAKGTLGFPQLPKGKKIR